MITITIPAELAAEYATACRRGADRAGLAFERSGRESDEIDCVRLDALDSIIRAAYDRRRKQIREECSRPMPEGC